MGNVLFFLICKSTVYRSSFSYVFPPWSTFSLLVSANQTTQRKMFLNVLLLVDFTQAMHMKNENEPKKRLSTKVNKIPKFLNLITWVQFDNTECAATSGDNGTCFTSNECSEIGGTADGTCASGFGVCCVLQVQISQKTFISSIIHWLYSVQLWI